MVVPGPPLAAAGHLTELGALLLASNVVSLTNLDQSSLSVESIMARPYLGPGVDFTQLTGPVAAVATKGGGGGEEEGEEEAETVAGLQTVHICCY